MKYEIARKIFCIHIVTLQTHYLLTFNLFNSFNMVEVHIISVVAIVKTLYSALVEQLSVFLQFKRSD
jgi:hypothetical protein